jgi:hypothetical protein
MKKQIKKYSVKAWKGLTSPKAKATYKSTGKTISKVGKFTAGYFEKMNKNLDCVVGTRDPNPRGRLAGVKLKKRRRY